MEYLLIFGGVLIAYITLRISVRRKRAAGYGESIRDDKYDLINQTYEKITQQTNATMSSEDGNLK